ncbi:MAG: ferritin-like domain-containing protein [Actinobacteria bacterium]|nr:ferritin-like domain-containing protein [Actinomycetota bacterium]
MVFAIEDYKERTERLRVDDIDFDAFRHDPLDADTLRCLRYMHDVEFHTVCYLRDLLLTPAHHDPEITSFLTFWNFEEFWHGEALGRVLDAHGEASGDVRIARVRQRLGWRDRVRPALTTLSSATVGRAFVAVHMTWGAINEWSTQAGYARVSARANHPVLTDLLSRIMKQEGRHIDFYGSEATKRLAESAKARKVTRFALKHFWAPVGTGVMPDVESRFLINHLLEGEDGRSIAERIDRRIDRLPGLAGLGLVSAARTNYAA